jgi:hypothetical protein
VAVLAIDPCQPVDPAVVAKAAKPKQPHPVKRYFRRQLLVLRHDLFRSNIVYGAFDLSRMVVKSLAGPKPELPIAALLRSRNAGSSDAWRPIAPSNCVSAAPPEP